MAVATAQAARPVIYVVPSDGWSAFRPDTAFGLYVPGAGGTVSRAGAIASLERGKVENAVLGGVPGGKKLADVVFGAPATPRLPAAFVTIPPPGTHPNTRRYSVAIVAPGYGGILVSDATRIRGLVAVADIAPTLVDLQAGRTPPIRSEPERDVAGELRELDSTLTEVHRVRGWTTVVVVLAVLLLIPFAPRAAVLGGASAIAGSVLLAWAGATGFAVALPAMALLTIALAAGGSARRRFVPIAVAVFLAAYCLVLALDPELNSLGVLGARPDGGGRFHGIGNQLETLLLPPVLAACFAAGLRFAIPLTALALFTIGWSKAGADGGGLVVFGAALAVLFFRSRGLAITARRAALAAVSVVVATLALVGLDAATGGSSHVTRAVGTGPDTLLGDLGHRLHLSWESATSHWYRIAIFLACACLLVWMATIRPRRATVDSMLVALVVSLFVNDTPVDVIGLGALGCAALLRWESVDSRAMRRGALTAASLLAVLALAGCGDEGTVRATPETVVGTVQAAAPGKAIFINQGCGSCHTYEPAGPEANGTIGPDLDNLPQDAQRAKQQLEPFVHESIVNPDAYIEPGFPKGVMPKSYKDLPADDLNALVDFLTKPQG